jgi:squalene-hopene/tetraprenyl-beta-curcumene cyclase
MVTNLKTLSQQSLQSFAMDIFSPSILESARQTKSRVEPLMKNWSTIMDVSLFDQQHVISMYDCYPYLFQEAFPNIPSDRLSDFSVASSLFATSLIFSDKIIDLSMQAHASAQRMLHVVALQTEALSYLHQLFPASSPFWERFRTYMGQYYQACIREKRFVSGELSWRDYDEDIAWTLATGKSGVSQAIIAGLVDLAGTEQYLLPFTRSLNLFNFSCQMFDDICDWKEDYLNRSPSLVLCRLLKERPVEPKEQDLKQIARELYYGGHICTVLQQAIDAFDEAISIVPGNVSWIHLVSKLRERCEDLLTDIIKISQSNRRRTAEQPVFQMELPAPQTQCQQLAWQGLHYLVQQWQKGFGEARHVMGFSYKYGFTGKSEFQYGDIFQRAVMAEIFSDVNQAFSLKLQPVINYEINYLIENRLHAGIEGWGYFPDLPELPPDADDLAQVMQVLLLNNRLEDVSRYCEQPLRVLLEENRHDDGSFETWIIPAHNRTLEQERHTYYAANAWGTGADVDVMANVLYTLALYDETRFAEVIQSGTEYIEKHQAEDGSWTSTWYHGPFYGTYVCTRLLAKVKPTSPAIDRVRAFLKSSQHADGRWGMPEKEGDPLNTSLALLSWAYLTQPGKLEDAAPSVQKALAYLQYSYDEEGQCWPYQEYIRMQRPMHVLSYGSKSITTAYVIKAAAAWQHLQYPLS